MKIGFVLDESLDKPDGVQQYVINMGAWLTSVGHNVHYLVGETRRRDIANVHSLSRNLDVKFNQNRLSTPLPVKNGRLKALLDYEKFDILHVQAPYSPFLAARLIRLASPQTAIVSSFHILPYSTFQTMATRLLGLYLRKNAKRFDFMTGMSKPAARFASKTFGRPTSVLPNCVVIKTMAEGRRLSRYDDGKINIVFLGRLVERKGCRQLLEALKLLHSKHILLNVRVLICGKGPLDAELKAFVQVNHLGSIVHFTGFLNEADKPDYLASADIAVFPSMGGESFGIVLIEAMAAGSGVVLAGNNAGYKSVLGERKDQVFDPRDVSAFAQTLKHFILNGKARKSAKRWQLEAVKQYDVNEVGQRLLKLYAQAVAKRTK